MIQSKTEIRSVINRLFGMNRSNRKDRMITRKQYHLKAGTVLDERYTVGEILGEGGFGITYEAVSIHTGRRVAVKEFFCKDYMDRKIDEGDGAVLTEDHDAYRYSSEIKRFIREARILGEFKDEPGIVQVLDCFEANNTAYLVMEYIDGINMKKKVEDHGRIQPEVFFEKIRPMLHSLDKIHRAGVVHRDISPDNIMCMKDGSMILIDFGSAKNLGSGSTQTAAPTFKEGYAPPEQYRTDVSVGPEMDIYSLCASFYYCLTGTDPVSSIHRVLHDEMKPIETFCADLPLGICSMISKGLSLMPDERQHSVKEITDVLDDIYPVITAEEKKRRRDIRITTLAGAGLIVAIAAGAVMFGIRDSLEHRSTLKPKQTLSVLYEDMPQQDIDYWQSRLYIMQSRLGGKEVDPPRDQRSGDDHSYESIYRTTFSSGKLHGNNTYAVCEKYLLCIPRTLKISHADEDGNTAGGDCVTLKTTDIDSAMSNFIIGGDGSGNIPISENSTADVQFAAVHLTDEASEKAKDMLSHKGEHLDLTVTGDTVSYSVPAFSGGDGKSFFVIVPESVDRKQLDKAIGESAKEDRSKEYKIKDYGDCFTEAFCVMLGFGSLGYAEADKTPPFYADMDAVWETAQNNLSAGEYQVNEEKITGETLVLEYDSMKGEPLDRTDYLNRLNQARERLDRNKALYAVGTLSHDRDRILIRIGRDSIDQKDAETLVDGMELMGSYLFDKNGRFSGITKLSDINGNEKCPDYAEIAEQLDRKIFSEFGCNVQMDMVSGSRRLLISDADKKIGFSGAEEKAVTLISEILKEYGRYFENYNQIHFSFVENDEKGNNTKDIKIKIYPQPGSSKIVFGRCSIDICDPQYEHDESAEAEACAAAKKMIPESDVLRDAEIIDESSFFVPSGNEDY